MSYLLDTVTVSELRKPESRADPGVRGWVSGQDPRSLHLSVVTVMEIEIGIGRLERRDVPQAAVLRRWLESEVLDLFHDRVLAVDLAVARRAASFQVPDPRPERDVLIAATASANGLTVVTRNRRDFEPTGVPVLDPWGREEPT